MVGNRFTILSKGLKRKRGEKNNTETAYARELSLDPEVADWWFEPMSLRLTHPPAGQPARVSMDFMVLMQDGTTYMDDVKGGMVDPASIVRIKCAAELYPLWKFRIVKKQAKKNGGGWKIQEV